MKLSSLLKHANDDQYLIEYTSWNDFNDKINAAIDSGFSDEKELLEKVGFSFELYEKIAKNMIFHWKDSVSKSLLHTVSNLDFKMPQMGSKIFRDLVQQTRALLIIGPGHSERNIFGDENSAVGLNIISKFSFGFIPNDDPNVKVYDPFTKEQKISRWKLFDSIKLLTLNKPEDIQKANMVLKYIWLYVFYHRYKLKKEKTKLPKYLYRGIRFQNIYNEKEISDIIQSVQRLDTESWISHHEKRIDLIYNYLKTNGINKIIPGKFLSFTASENIADYFANGEGFILRVEPKNVEIITSELTEPLFDQKDYVSNKKEREYIIKIPENYKFTNDDIKIVDLDYFIAKNNPLCVQYFDHDDKGAEYILNGKKVKAKYFWSSNTRGGVEFQTDEDGWAFLSRRQFKETHGFDPLPTEKNLNEIKDFKFVKRK